MLDRLFHSILRGSGLIRHTTSDVILYSTTNLATKTLHNTHSPDSYTKNNPLVIAHFNCPSIMAQKQHPIPIVSVTFDIGLGEQHKLNCLQQRGTRKASQDGLGKVYRMIAWHWYDRLQYLWFVFQYIWKTSSLDFIGHFTSQSGSQLLSLYLNWL